MKGKKLLVGLIIGMIILAACETEDIKEAEEINTTETTMSEIEKEMELVFGKDPTIDYSNDRAANQFIERYNELNPDDIITKERVSCPDNSGIYLTIIEFDYMDFVISECDGSPSYRCESISEFNDENTKGFFDEAFYMVQAVEQKLEEDEVKELLEKLQEGEYPFNNTASPKSSSRRFSFKAPDNIEKDSRGSKTNLTYDLYWNHASY